MTIKLPNLYEFSSYKSYLLAVIALNKDVRAMNQVLADLLKCHRTLLSRVLKGDEHISIESGMNFCESQDFTPKETQYFLKTLLFERTHQKNLREFFRKEIEDLKTDRSQVKERILEQGTSLSYAQETYYRSWIPSAVHLLTNSARSLSAPQIAKRLRLSTEIIESVLEELRANGLVRSDAGRWEYVGDSIHLGKESPYYLSFYQSWGDRALASLVNREMSEDNMHFTGVISVSKESRAKVKEALLKALENIRSEIATSSDEDDITCLRIDYFTP